MGKLAIIAILSLITLLLVISAGCGGGGTSTQNNVSWKTDQVLLEADNFYIVADGQNFYGNDETLDIGSDPGSHHYTTLELEWQEHGVEMRLYIYLKADDTYWWSDEIRTYDGKQDSNWIYYHGTFFRSRLGSAFKGDIVLKSDPDNDYAGEIHFEKLNLQAFLFKDIKDTIEGYISTFNAGDFNTCLTY
ncbi:MAG: hypothetical protein JSW38_06665 [Dehalococcoidia bacterium]|nr:MAG: hypothetical protein JSW38_06665 [Dehalococcoidia bacterium]